MSNIEEKTAACLKKMSEDRRLCEIHFPMSTGAADDIDREIMDKTQSSELLLNVNAFIKYAFLQGWRMGAIAESIYGGDEPDDLGSNDDWAWIIQKIRDANKANDWNDMNRSLYLILDSIQALNPDDEVIRKAKRMVCQLPHIM